MSVMSDTERYRPQYPPPVGAGVLPRPYFDHEDFLEQETRHKFDQLARLHELYQSKLALANVSNSVTYQRENSSNANVRETPCKSHSKFHPFRVLFHRVFFHRAPPLVAFPLASSNPLPILRRRIPIRKGNPATGRVVASEIARSLFLTIGLGVYNKYDINAGQIAAAPVFRPPSRCQSLSLSDVMFNDNASNHGSIYSEPAYIAGKSDQEKICDNCRQSMTRPATASYWYPNSVAHIASPRRYCGKLGDCNISSLRHPDGASNPNLKEEVERLPGNGASGSDPEEEYVEAKKLFTAAERSGERTVTGKSDIEEDLNSKIQGEEGKISFCFEEIGFMEREK